VSAVRFRFADFIVSPARRQVLRGGQELPLIPRYFDLLLLLLERRGQAVTRRDILERVWTDVVVSDGALNQAVRTLRRTLGDDSHEPTFIRTVSRHGYRFAYPVVEEPDPEAATAPPSLVPAQDAGGAWRRHARRCPAAVGWAAAAGALAGGIGGLALLLAPGSQAPATTAAVLALVGTVVAALGAAGVAAGLAAAEALAPARLLPALALGGALGGGTVGILTHHLVRWTLQGVFGREIASVGGGWEGVVLGAAAGLGYGVAAFRRPATRLRAVLLTGAACGLAGLLASACGANLVSGSLNTLARSFQGSQVRLAPVARLLGEADLGPVTRNALGAYEGAFFGFGLALGFARRPR
jgi:transcriptional regulator HilA, main transcriptional regulator of SPI1